MADANSSWSEIITTTLENRSGQVADNVTNTNALLQRLNMNGNIRTASGGRVIAEELEYAENSTFKYYSGYEQLSVAASTVFSAAEFAWKQAAAVITASGLEIDVQNTGPEQVINLFDKRITNAEHTMANNLSTGIYSDGTGTGGKQITGLQALVADAPSTGTVGGINRANFSFWQNSVYDFSDQSVTASATTMEGAMQNLWLDCVRGNEMPDLIPAGKTYYQFFWESQSDKQRFTDPNNGISGFSNLKFANHADVVYDNSSAGLSATRMYFLNTQYIYWRPHSSRNMVPLNRRDGVNQDAVVVPLVFAGNMTMSNAERQGVLVP